MTEDDARSAGSGGSAGSARSAGAGSDPDRPLRSGALPESVRCPFCEGSETEQFSAFGSAVSTSQYYCRRCHTVFEFMKQRR